MSTLLSLQKITIRILLLATIAITSSGIYAQTSESDKLKQFEDAILRGEDFLQAKDYAKAKAEYQKALVIDPSAQYPKDKLSYIRKFYIDPEDEARFSQAIASGNQLITAKDFGGAIEQFRIAANIKPEDKNAKENLVKAEKLYAEQQENDKQYAKLITEADKLFVAKDLPSAREKYAEASKIKIEEKYPRQRISEIDAKTEAEKSQKEAYEKALAEGDDAYMNRDFTNARLKYELALKIKPGENYPKSMLERVAEGLAQMKDAQQNYQQAIAGADKLFNSKDFETALLAYQNASKILPSEKYPPQQIEKIEAILLEKQKLEEKYAQTISAGDQYFEAQQFADAKTEFQKANDLKPDEIYPRQKIEEIAVLLLAQKEAERTKIYDALIADADRLFSSKEFDASIAKYQEASTIKTDETYPKEKIAAIHKLLATEQANQIAYEQAIETGDNNFKTQAFDLAIKAYEQAHSLKPDEVYPSAQISKANAAIEELKKTEDAYQATILKADQQMSDSKLEDALESYKLALSIKPGSEYPLQQTEKINLIIAANKSKEEQYLKLIENGDRLFQSGTYNEALTAYNQSLQLKPEEKYPAEQIKKINILNEALKAKQQSYNQLITDADLLFNKNELEKSLQKYSEALTIMPEEKYPQDKIAQINIALEQLKSRDENYAKNLNEADLAFKKGDFENAIAFYEKAQILKPSETYPGTQIELIKTEQAKQKVLNDNYSRAITAADLKLAENSYEEAIALYQSASEIKPAENYPVEQINKAREAIIALQQKEESYSKAIAEADKLMTNNNLNGALAVYQQALTIKPESNYPQEQIEKINASLAASRSKDEQYQKLLDEAELQFKSQNYDKALNTYTQALEIKPEEKFPGQQIEKINGLISDLKAIQNTYNEQIAAADKFFADAAYEKALLKYNEALQTKPEETYPKDRISSINTILEQRKSLDDNYNRLISEGDIAFKADNLDNAIRAFEAARLLKPEEQYPQLQIAMIGRRIENQRILDENYNMAIAEADRFLQEGKTEPALAKYKEALTIKAGEAYPQKQIDAINNQLTKLKETNATYQQTIKEADRLFGIKNLDEALTKYNEAKTLKPTEPWPAKQILAINTILNAQKQAELEYTSTLERADRLFEAESYDEAESTYKEALQLKPEEEYPANQITLISNKKSELQTLNTNYLKAIEEADKLFESKEYREALLNYEKALSLKPAETHPRDRINSINSILEELRYLADKDYNDAVEKANREFNLQDYTSARKSYELASSIKPEEAYPKNKLLEISAILMERSRNQMEAYNKIIMKADLAYQEKIYDQAIDAYEEAKIAKPDEVYPGEMISKIRKYMEDHAVVNLVMEPVVILKDTEQKFKFTPIEMRLRKNNYIIIKARKTGETEPKVYLNYGIDGQKSGGIVLKSIKSDITGDYMVRVSMQDRWYRLDNNWIAVYAEGADLEISKMQIAQGD